MASIIIMSGSQNEYYTLDEDVYVLGRSENLRIQILDEYVSREHLQIHFDRQKNRFYASDLDSRHGVFINGRRIVAEAVLLDDDRIRIGDTTILFTNENFSDSDSAFSHFKKAGEYEKPTQVE